MLNINQMPVSIEEFMYPKSDPNSANESTSDGETTYPNYFTMIPNIPNVPMATAAMPNYNPALNLTNGVPNGGENKEKENISPNQSVNG